MKSCQWSRRSRHMRNLPKRSSANAQVNSSLMERPSLRFAFWTPARKALNASSTPREEHQESRSGIERRKVCRSFSSKVMLTVPPSARSSFRLGWLPMPCVCRTGTSRKGLRNDKKVPSGAFCLGSVHSTIPRVRNKMFASDSAS